MNQKILVYGGNKKSREDKIYSYIPHKFKEGSHPDLLMIDVEEDKKSIGIGDVSKIFSFISTKPFSEKSKVVIILHADLLTEEAQNSLLKTIEEASKYIEIYLEASSIKKILPTIISRCILINLGTEKIKSDPTRKNFFELNISEKLEWVDKFSKATKEEVLIELHLTFADLKNLNNTVQRKKITSILLDLIENLSEYNLNIKIALLNLVMQIEKVFKA